jgi:hypothetical protein
MLDLITMQAFRDELVKIAGVMDDAAREGIQLAKKLKARGLAGKLRGNTLKDYVHHMDLSAHPKFKAPGTGGGTQKNFSDAGMLAHAGIKKVGAGGLSPALSMGGLAGLTALEGSQAFNKKKSKKERGMAAASAGATGSILAAEGIHNKDMLKSGLKKANKWATGKAPSAMDKIKNLAGKAAKFAKRAEVEKVSMDLWNPATGKVFGEAASKVKGLASGAGKAAAKPKVDASKMLEQIKSMKRTGQTGTISAKTFGKAAAAYNFDKEAFIGKLLGKAAPAAKSAFKPSFAGHAKSLGVGAATNAKGVTTTKSFNNLSQSMSKKKHIEIPGLA